MRPHVAATEMAARLATTAVFAVVLIRLLTLPLPADRLTEEVLLGVAAVAYWVLALRRRHWGAGESGPVAVLQGSIPAWIAAAMIIAASPFLPGAEVITVLLFAAIQFGVTPDPRPGVLAVSGVVVDAAFAFAFLTGTGGGVTTLAIAIVILAALQVVVVARAQTTAMEVEAELVRSSAHAVTAVRVGTSIDVNGVTRAVLSTSLDAFPLTTAAMLFLHDSTMNRLRPLPLYVGAAGIVTLESDNLDFTLTSGEGLAGKVFAASRPLLWTTAHDVNVAQANLGEQARMQLLALRRGAILSAVGAPLAVEDEVVGAFVLASHRRELAWSELDLTVVSALAAEAARAIERARRYERELDQAHLDSITGLANHRQLTRTLDQEVARARRRGSPLGVVFCDLDRFKSVNDTYGHAAGDRVLTILARVFHESLRREDSAARYGGDEFVCVLPGADRAETEAIGRRIASSFEVMVGEDAQLAMAGVTISCGIAIFPDDGDGVEALLDHADSAMRVVKVGRRAPGAALRGA